MPFNDKNEWVNPPIESYPKSELDRGYSICYCKDYVHLHQSGYDCQMITCELCNKEVSTVKEFLTVEECEKLMPKVTVKDEIKSSGEYKLM